MNHPRKDLAHTVQERRLIPLCILPSQGLASGDPAKDAQPVRFMVHEGLPVLLVQSFDAVSPIFSTGIAVIGAKAE